MDVGLTVYGKCFVFGKHLCPQLSVSLERPIVFIESAPKDRTSVFVKVLFNNDPVAEMSDIHYTYGIIGFSVYSDIISSCDIDNFFVSCDCYFFTISFNFPKRGYINLKPTVILTKSPVIHKNIAVKERKGFTNTVFNVTFGKISTVGIGKLCYKISFGILI